MTSEKKRRYGRIALGTLSGASTGAFVPAAIASPWLGKAMYRAAYRRTERAVMKSLRSGVPITDAQAHALARKASRGILRRIGRRPSSRALLALSTGLGAGIGFAKARRSS